MRVRLLPKQTNVLQMNDVIIGIWAYLFCGPLSEGGQIFGWMKWRLYLLVGRTEWLFKPIIGCAKCHAGQIALWHQVYCYSIGAGFDFSFIIIAIFVAHFCEWGFGH